MTAKIRRRALLGAASLPLLPAVAHAQSDWPNRPVRIIVPFPPGQATDIITRLVADELSKRWPQRVIVENRGGGAGAPAMEAGARSPADGYTLIAGTSGTLGVNPSVLPRLPYDAEKDFAAITNVAMVPLLVVAHPSLPHNTMQELAAAARAQPGALDMASAGPATSQHMAAELLMLRANIRFNIVHYRGSGPAIADVIAGNVKLMTDSVASSLPHIREGRVKPIALCSARRVPQLPEVPTIAEALVPGYQTGGWAGLVAPTGTPADIIRRINADVTAILRDPAIAARIIQMGAVPDPMTPEEHATFIRNEIATFREVARAANVRLEG
jgi:tripartite-type tricarboxylate transporter receptor subunit TctC